MTPAKLPFGIEFLRRLPIPRKLGILEKLYGKTLSHYGTCWVKTSNGVTWKLNLNDSTQRWIVFGDYEGIFQMNWIRGWLKQGGTVIDSGANIGQMCLYLAPLPKVRVIAFEPLPEAYCWLQECLANYPNWDVVVHKYGLSDQKKTISVQVDGSRSTARMDWYVTKNLPIIDINVTSLDDFANINDIASIKLWKLDVEGHELEALRGARGLITNKKVDAILVEVSSNEVIPFLRDSGYSIKRISSNGSVVSVIRNDYRGNCIATPAV